MKSKMEIVKQMVLVSVLSILNTYYVMTGTYSQGLIDLLSNYISPTEICSFLEDIKRHKLSPDIISSQIEAIPVFLYTLNLSDTIGGKPPNTNILNLLYDTLKCRGDRRSKQEIIQAYKPADTGLYSNSKKSFYMNELGFPERVACRAVCNACLVLPFDSMKPISDITPLLSKLFQYHSLKEFVNAVSLRDEKQLIRQFDKYYDLHQVLQDKPLHNHNSDIALLLNEKIVNERLHCLQWMLSNKFDWFDIPLAKRENGVV